MPLDRSAATRAAVVALPGLALAGAGLTHPHSLTAASAERWTQLHVVGLLVFPLVGWALSSLVRGRTDPVAWVARLTAYVYATAYSALDVISGIGAGYVTWRLGVGVPRPDEVRFLFSVGGQIGEVGSWALLACTVVVLLDSAGRLGAAAAPAVVLPAGGWLVHTDHIFSPYGALGMLALGLGTGWLAWQVPPADPVSPSARPRRSATRGPGRR